MKSKNPIAVALGKLAAGKPKNYSPEEIQRRRERLIAMNAARFWQVVEAGPEELNPSKCYFIVQRSPGGFYSFYSKDERFGSWTKKPRIALKFFGNCELKEALEKSPKHVAVEVPEKSMLKTGGRKRWKTNASKNCDALI